MYQMGIMRVGFFFPPNYHLADTHKQSLEINYWYCRLFLVAQSHIFNFLQTQPQSDEKG